jgi:ribosome-associated protein
MLPSTEELLREISFKTSRSGGKGGQNVNKVSSKVELIFNVNASLLFSPEQKALISEKLAGKIDTGGDLHVVSQEDRSQLVNRERSIEKLIDLLIKALIVQKKRKPTKIPKEIIMKRLKDKSVNADKKSARKKVDRGDF